MVIMNFILTKPITTIRAICEYHALNELNQIEATLLLHTNEYI